MSDALLAQVRAWIDDDTDPDTRAELEALLADNDTIDLQRRFSGLLTFGTAGLRGLVGAGPNRMNRCVVARVTAALCAHLKTIAPDREQHGLCIGFDGRHKSRELAQEASEIALGAGFVVHTFERVIATPLLAHAVPLLGADAGIMITASHNPPAYNGYKVYAASGAQLIAPHDAAVTQLANAIPSASALPRGELHRALQEGDARLCDAHVIAHYEARLRAQIAGLPTCRVPITIAYTALHGVGEWYARRALSLAGFDHVHSVIEQAEPDPRFPTVEFPNPEEPSAMMRVMALADTTSADLVLANDPDADRVAVGARDEQATMRLLTGNEVGLLLTDFVLRHANDPQHMCVLSSIVTTSAVQHVAQAYGAHWEPTLTGTKWICTRALELEKTRGLTCAIGFEEAIGYCIGNVVREKDGIGAAVHIALMAAEEKAAGLTLHGALERLYRRHGFAASRQVSLSLSGDDAVSRVTRLLRSIVTAPPDKIGDARVLKTVDLSLGTTLPATPGVILELEHDRRVCIRPSGTEPKLKCYLDLRMPFPETQSFSDARATADAALDKLAWALATLLA